MNARVVAVDVRSGSLPELDPSFPIGLYVVQSTDTPTCFRAGAAGIRPGQRGSLLDRLRRHAGGMPNRITVNWTEFHQPWQPIWAVQLLTSNQAAGRLAEQLLFGTLAAEYTFLRESGESGFVAEPHAAAAIAALAAGIEGQIARIVERQGERAAVPGWIREDPAAFAARLTRPGVAKTRRR